MKEIFLQKEEVRELQAGCTMTKYGALYKINKLGDTKLAVLVVDEDIETAKIVKYRWGGKNQFYGKDTNKRIPY